MTIFPLDAPSGAGTENPFDGIRKDGKELLVPVRPVAGVFKECRSSLEELRRRGRARILQRRRQVPDLSSVGASPALGPVTRSKGFVPVFPNVQQRILERKSRDKRH